MRRIGVEERRARLGFRHHLMPESRATDVAEVANDLVGLHGTDAASVYLAARARLHKVEPTEIESALYDQRTIVRILGMRRTMFVVPVELAPVVHAACTEAIAVKERRQLVQLLEAAGIADDAHRWLEPVEQATVRALLARGEATAAELSKDVPELREQMHFGEGKKWEGYQSVSTRVLFLLAAEGRIVRGRPRGSWTSTQYRWAPMDSWLPARLVQPSLDEARVELARRWLRAFGPAPAADLKWWTGWTMGEVKRALAEVAPIEVDLDGVTGLMLGDDVERMRPPEPWAALLPALDPTAMGWADRSWFLGDHRLALFDRSGNVGPTVWWDGRIVGGWAQRKDGEIATRLLEDVGADAKAAIEDAAVDLGSWLGPVRVTPRFRTPLERELAN